MGSSASQWGSLLEAERTGGRRGEGGVWDARDQGTVTHFDHVDTEIFYKTSTFKYKVTKIT